MYKVGFVDDDYDAFADYKKRMRRKGFELCFVDNCSSLDDILNWILNNSIECLLVDHKLTAKYEFHGTKVVAYINNQLPDLPCVILTNYPEHSINDNLVIKNLIYDRNTLSHTDLSEFCNIIIHATEVFRNRLRIHLDEYSELFRKKREHVINADEEDRFLNLYRILKSYGEVDDIAIELLKPDFNKKVDTLMKKLDQFIDSKQQD